MAVEVRIPAVLRRHSGGERTLEAQAGVLREVLTDLAGRYPELGEQLLGEDRNLHRFVNVYVNDEDVRYLSGLETQVGEGDVISILPAVAGGSLVPPAA
ncbi:MAG: MoaD family protein [Candidatus Methylomirabilales bacterium]